MVKVINTNLREVKVIEHEIFKDHRGKFIESFNYNNYKKILKDKTLKFVQDDFSYSKNNVLRGFHGEKNIHKIVSCIYGKIRIAIFCNKEDHQDYLKVFSKIISENDNLQIYVPPMYGIAHYVISERAIFHYKQTGYYKSNTQFTYKWNSKNLKMNWGNIKPILSKRDKFYNE